MPLPSPERSLRDSMNHFEEDKWGWVIYRCTYGDDVAWARFRSLMERQSQMSLADSDTPEIADSLEWTFAEDRNSLDGTSKDQLRDRFLPWAAEAVKAEQPRLKPHHRDGIVRYNFFI